MSRPVLRPVLWGRVLALAALAGLAVAAVGLSGSELAVPFGAVLSGLTGLSGGALVVARSLPVRRGELSTAHSSPWPSRPRRSTRRRPPAATGAS